MSLVMSHGALLGRLFHVSSVLFYWYFFFFKQKTAYEMRISDWSSDVCSSDLGLRMLRFVDLHLFDHRPAPGVGLWQFLQVAVEIGRASCRERVCQYV